MSTDTHEVVQRKAQARSRVTNGKQLLVGLDGRSAGARRLHDIIAALLADLGGEPTETDRLQVRAVAALTLHAEGLTAAMANGEAVDSDEMTRVANAAQRGLASLSRRRRSRRQGHPPSGDLLAGYVARGVP